MSGANFTFGEPPYGQAWGPELRVLDGGAENGVKVRGGRVGVFLPQLITPDEAETLANSIRFAADEARRYVAPEARNGAPV